MKRFGLLGALVVCVVVWGAYQMRQTALLCPAQGRVLTRGEILQGAQRFAVADLKLFYNIVSSTEIEVPEDIDLAILQAAQPDCCTVLRRVTAEFEAQTQLIANRMDAPPLRMFVQIKIENPALLPTVYKNYEQIIGMDVCGDAIQDWVTVSQPLQV